MTPALSQVRLMIIDDHAMFREGIAGLVEREHDMAVVAKCESAAEALAQLQSTQPSIVLLDFDLGAERAIDFVAEARLRGFTGKFLVVTAGISDPEAVTLVQSGVSGILHKHNTPEILCGVIRRVMSGGVSLEAKYLKPLFQSVEQGKSDRPRLTDRDKLVLRCVFQGLANKEISTRLQITEGAVKASLRQLCAKLKVHTRAQLVKIALEQYKDQL